MKTNLLILLSLFTHSTNAAEEAYLPIKVPTALRGQLNAFEPSAGIYLTEVKKYLIASDDTTDTDAAWLFLMNEKGVVEAKPVVLEGVEKMTDIESISRTNDGSIFILSAQGTNRKNESILQRNMFVQAKWEAGNLKTVNRIELRPYLVKALMNSTDPVLAKMRDRYDSELNIESHFIKNNELYVGLKSPQPAKSRAAIINLGPTDDIFKGQVSAKLWKTIAFHTDDRITNYLSEMLWIGNDLWTTTSNNKIIGHLWRVRSPMRPKIKASFKAAHPEAIIYKDKHPLVLFDQGSRSNGFYFFLKD